MDRRRHLRGSFWLDIPSVVLISLASSFRERRRNGGKVLDLVLRLHSRVYNAQSYFRLEGAIPCIPNLEDKTKKISTDRSYPFVVLMITIPSAATLGSNGMDSA